MGSAIHTSAEVMKYSIQARSVSDGILFGGLATTRIKQRRFCSFGPRGCGEPGDCGDPTIQSPKRSTLGVPSGP
jgi:hypothetical protein